MPTEIISRHCFAVLTRNEPGVLARVVGLFSGRGYNIESLTVDEVDPTAHLSRMTIVTRGAPMVINQIKAQLERLVPVLQVVNLTEQGNFVENGLAYLKVVGDAALLAKAREAAEASYAHITNTSGQAVIFELAAPPHKIDALIARLTPLGLVEIARTGSLAMTCGESIVSVANDTHAQGKSA